jgi:hypothetical protein
MIRGAMANETRWEQDDDIVARVGSTRPTQLANGELVSFAREALEDALAQVENGYVPMNFEHLQLFPPIGRWYAGEIVRADDGEDELLLRGRFLRRLRPEGDDPNVWRLLDAYGIETADPPSAVAIEHVSLEPRNFDPADLEAARAAAPVPVQEETRWSELPPIEWVLSIPVLWGLAKFAGSFLDTLGRAAGEAVVAWLRDLSAKAKDGSRDRIVTLQFVLPDETTILGFIPVRATDDFEREVRRALDGAGNLAALAGLGATHNALGDARATAFLWKDEEWHLAWSVGADDAVRVTNWYLANEPDATRFLGRPLFPDE